MAAIDKIYGTREQWVQLHTFLRDNEPEFLKYMYHKPGSGYTECPLSNFPKYVDIWLMENCKLDFVQERLKEQYSNAD